VSVYLGIADRYALAQGIWLINPERSTGIAISGLPIAEALFFFLTSLMIVQSVVLVMSPGLAPRVVLGRLRGYWRAVAGNGGSRKGGSH
jgi:hypothetical protein